MKTLSTYQVMRFVHSLLLAFALASAFFSLPTTARMQGETVLIPIGVGDITIFIPILPTISSATISQSGDTLSLSWSAVTNAAYYQIIVTDSQGNILYFQTTGTQYLLTGLGVGNYRIEVQACNKTNQCSTTQFAGSVNIRTAVRYQHTDMLGSVIAESDSSGSIISRNYYEPFGKRMGGDKAGIGYTGHLQDEDLGLTYMQARYYDPLIGRFYVDDPVGFRDLHSFNRYAYANNNPYKYVDPDGNSNVLAYTPTSTPVGRTGVTSKQNSALAKRYKFYCWSSTWGTIRSKASKFSC